MAGPVVRRTAVTTNGASSVIGGSPLSPGSASTVNTKTAQWNIDPAAGAGVDIRAGRFHLEPEVRYSYWRAGKTGPVRKNQVNFLIGFRF